MILEDDAFSAIAFVVERGRVIVGDMRKFVIYFLWCNVSESLVIAPPSSAGTPLPILPLRVSTGEGEER